MKLDRRLANRRGWIEDVELSRSLADLPDVATKAAEAPPPAASSEEPAAKP